MQLGWRGRAGSGDPAFDNDVRALAAGGEGRLYAATGRSGGVTALSVDAEGATRMDGTRPHDAPGGAAQGALAVAGDRLGVGGPGGAAVHALGAGGAVGGGHGAGGAVTALAVLDTEAGPRLLAAGTAGLAPVLPGGGTGRPLGGDAHRAAEAVALETATRGGAGFVLAADPAHHGVLALRLSDDGTAATLTGTMGAADGLGVSHPAALATVTVHGATFVLLAAAGSDSISVMRLDGAGRLTPTDHVIDTGATRFGGVQALEVIETGGPVLVVAGGADDGLSLFTLLPDGRLVHLQAIPNGAAEGLDDITAIAAIATAGGHEVFAAAEGAPGLAQLSLPADRIGAVRRSLSEADGRARLEGTARDDLLVAGDGDDVLSGGAGDDVLVAGPGRTALTGGAGADVFVLSGAATRTWIEDFEPGTDRIDPTDLPMLRNPGQIDVMPLDDGARLRHGARVVTVRAADGDTLGAADLFGPGPGFGAPDRVLVLGYATGLWLEGTPEPERLRGADEGDTLAGGGGTDTLEGGGGDDRLKGGEGADSVTGGDGDDRVLGGTGADTLRGGAGTDSLWGEDGADRLYGDGGDDILGGGAGDDALWAGDGDDTAIGNDGDDVLGGVAGNDRLWAGPGDDTVYAAAGNDTVAAGWGTDEIWGGTGDDRLYGTAGAARIGGGPGHDVIWGARDADLLYGVDGDDFVGGGGGDDTMWAGTGADTLSGGAGADALRAGPGDDRLSGGTGADLLAGGDGADLFVFAPGDGRDTIADLDIAAGDRLVLEAGFWDTPPPPAAEVLRDHARLGAEGTAVLDMGDGDVLVLDGVHTPWIGEALLLG
ncbi:Ca2+-binding protein, RTX toxin-related [Tranquillimonas rosea]|uniref:Ca2+-binding protein, RTX toxin-related n=1 Tax=Tranquillimonas rosea TaxID=641238 RepID=A0A1H9WYW6_9RHOB|nr:calcium-binding protein [Tranquillimonas rosea]SES39148.1 Ca2+-binding protein, RTX toxin-related [Tranquillimonas rosea]